MVYVLTTFLIRDKQETVQEVKSFLDSFIHAIHVYLSIFVTAQIK